MRNFWDLFLFHPIADDAEDLVMKLFSTGIYCNAREWYNNLLDANITSMEQFEETFLRRSGIQLEYISVLLKILEHIKKIEHETF
jgi:hypothetical protein